MKHVVGCVFLGLVVAAATIENKETKANYSGYSVVRATITNEDDVAFLEELQDVALNKIQYWNAPTVGAGYTLVQIPPEYRTRVVTLLEEHGLKPTVVFADLQEAIDQEARENQPGPRDFQYATQGRVSTFNYARYYPLDEINSFLDSVAAEFPLLAQTLTIGTSYEKRPIRGIRISTADPGTRPAIFVECGIHPREWVSSATALYIIGQLTNGYANDTSVQQILNKYEVYIIPSANPDGYVYTHKTNRNWRKTRSHGRMSPLCVGADANRNLDTNFCGVGSSSNPCSDTYCGASAFSEPETQALRNITTSLGSRLKIYFAIHSFSQLWMYPYGYTNKLPANAAELDRLSKIGTDALKKIHGKSYRYGTIAKTIYQASGSTIDWVYDTIGTKIAFALELRDTGTFGFLLPPGQIIPTATETWAGMKATILAV